jgi:hypothetical protein
MSFSPQAGGATVDIYPVPPRIIIGTLRLRIEMPEGLGALEADPCPILAMSFPEDSRLG